MQSTLHQTFLERNFGLQRKLSWKSIFFSFFLSFFYINIMQLTLHQTFLERNFSLQRKLSWKSICIQKITNILDKNVTEFNYKLLHNLLSNRYLVSKWNRDIDNKCILCNNEIENNMHLLYDCRNIQQIWKSVSTCLKFDIGWKHIIIGF